MKHKNLKNLVHKRQSLLMKILFILIFIINIMFANAFSVSIENYDPMPAEAGKYVNVWFKVENPTNEQNDEEFYIRINPMDGLEISPGEENRKRLGLLPPSSVTSTLFRLKVKNDAFEGENTIEVILENGDAEIKRILSIEVKDKDILEPNLQIGDIDSDPDKIKPDDKDVKIDITLLNLGDANIKGAKAELIDLPEGLTLTNSYSGTYLLGNINADSQSIATFNIDIDKSVKPYNYKANLNVSYKYKPDEDEDEYLIETTTIPLILNVKPTPLFEVVDIKLIPEKLRAGDENVLLILSIKNIGEEDGENIRVKIFGKTEQPFSFDISNDFVSPLLKPSEIGQATLQLDVDEEANLQLYYLDLQIKNIIDDDVITSSHSVPISVDYAKKSNPFKIVIIGIILLLGYVGYKYLKKKK